MNALATAALAVFAVPAAGQAFEGGYFVNRFRIGNDEFALIAAPKAAGEITEAWECFDQDIAAASSCVDGLANTQAMAAAGSKMAQQVLGLNINGHQDWYIPSRDELEILYRTFKPTDDDNCCSFRDGDNASSIPPGFPYTENAPGQTAVTAFQDGQPEAFDPTWYWASTPYSPTYAWAQDFIVGYQTSTLKGYEYRARAVRKIRISN